MLKIPYMPFLADLLEVSVVNCFALQQKNIMLNMYIHCVFDRRTFEADLDQQRKTFTQLQERFRKVVTEKKGKEVELTKAYSELEDSLSTLDNSATQ